MWLISLGLGTTAIFGTGCRYQVPTRTRGGTSGAVRELCIMVCIMDSNEGQEGSQDSWSRCQRVLGDIMKSGSIILQCSHFMTLHVTKLWNTFSVWLQDYSRIEDSFVWCIFVSTVINNKTVIKTRDHPWEWVTTTVTITVAACYCYQIMPWTYVLNTNCCRVYVDCHMIWILF